MEIKIIDSSKTNAKVSMINYSKMDKIEYDPAAEPRPANKEKAKEGFYNFDNAEDIKRRNEAVEKIIEASLENNPK
ncbi:hypothetical protein HC823_02140 [Candidatus Gracilibacteria bacterium]|nr:hypothetical protein [Candidatus Gracilibacteria bacterium]